MDKPLASYTGSDPYLFVSYAHLNDEVVYPEIRALQDAGYNVWFDQGIGAGLSWRDEVALAITECSLFVIFLTRESVLSEVCRQELFFALSRERGVLVIYLEDCQPSPGMELGISDKQAILKYELDPDAYWSKLTGTLEALHLDEVDEQREGAGLPADRGIAILPLRTRGVDAEVEYLSEGIAEELLTGMSRIDGLRVVSGFAFAEQQLDVRNIGLRFKVDTVLDGSIQQSGNRIRINMRLTGTQGGDALWAQRYEFDMTDIFDVQDRVAADVLEALHLTGDAGEGLQFGTNSVEAYESFLLGLFAKRKYEQAAFEQAVKHFRRATEIDVDFSRAWYQLGLCYWELTVFEGRSDRLIAAAEDAFDHARRQGWEPEIPWIQIERKLYPARRPAQRELVAEALEVLADPARDWRHFELVQIGRCLGAAGFYQAAFEFLSAYVDRVPLPAREVWEVRLEADGLLPILGRFNEAIQRATDEIEQDPDDSVARLSRCMLYSRTGQYTRAEADLQALAASPLLDFARFYSHFWRDQANEASQFLDRILSSEHIQLRWKWRACALLGRGEAAIAYMKESAARGAPLFHVRYLLANAIPAKTLAEIEALPAFGGFLRDQGIDDAWPGELAARLNENVSLTGIGIDLPR